MAKKPLSTQDRVKALEAAIKERVEEIDRINSIIIDIDNDIAEAFKTDGLNKATIRNLQKKIDYLSGVIALERANAEDWEDYKKATAQITEAQQLNSTDYADRIKHLQAKQHSIKTVLSSEEKTLADLEAEYLEACRAVELENVSAELSVFMKLSQEIAKSVVKLARFNYDMNGEIFYTNSAFALPLPLIEPFKSQAEKTAYHRDDCGYTHSATLTLVETLKGEIAAARLEQ